MSDGNQKVISMFVHGTWGRGVFPWFRISWRRRPRWFESTGRFRQELEKLLKERNIESITQMFEWSGSNSIRGRDAAARALAQKVNEIRNLSPDARLVLICHSHGGNVAARALRHIDDGANRIEIVTIATPFMQIIERGLDIYERRVISFSAVAFVCAGVLFRSLLFLDHASFWQR